MIRAATGKPTSHHSKKEEKKFIRPSSASGKLQSFAYVNLVEDSRPSTALKKDLPTSLEAPLSQKQPQPRFGEYIQSL